MTATARKKSGPALPTSSYPNAWQGWEADVLRAAGLPVTAANMIFLANWHLREGSAAANNPLNTTAYRPVPVTVGYKTLNSAGVQYYASAKQGAEATAAFLKMPNFTAIHAALASGDPYHYIAQTNGNRSSVVAQLAKWGSSSFAAVVLYEAPDAASSGPGGAFGQGSSQTHFNPDPSSGAGPSTSTKNASPSLTGWVGDLTSWLTSTGKLVLAYVLLVGVAGALLVKGLRDLGAPIPKPSTIAKGAAA